MRQGAFGPDPQQPVEGFAPHLGGQRRRDEPFGAPHLDLAHRKDRIARLHRLRTQRRGIGFGILRPVERQGARCRGRKTFAIGAADRKLPFGDLDHGPRRNHAPHPAALQRQREPPVAVPEDLRTGDKPLHAVRGDTAPLDGIDVRARRAAGRQQAESVARSEVRIGVERETPARDPRHAADPFADRLRGVERRHAGAFAVQEVFGFAARKALGGIRRKIRDALPDRGAAQARTCGQHFVERPAVVSHDVADITGIFQTPLDLERRDAGIDQFAEALREVQVADRQEVFSRNEFAAFRVGQIPGQAARLAARPAVATAPGHRPREEAAAAVPDADRPVDENLDLGRRRGADGPDLVERERPFENHAREARLGEEARPLGRAVGDLRRGVQFHGEVHPPQGHVLHDEGIDSGVDQLAGRTFGIGKLLVPEQRVERGVDPHAEAVGIRHDAGDLLRAIPGGLPRPEARAADIDGIGARIHGHDGRGVIPGRSQQFDGSHTD